MPSTLLQLNIPLNGTGTEIPALNILDNYNIYYIFGTATAIGNYAIVPTGTPFTGCLFHFKYKATLDITTNGTTFSLFGTSITQAQLLKNWEANCYYNGTMWEVVLIMDFSESGIVSSANIGSIISGTNIGNSSIDGATKLQNLSVTTAKIANDAITTVKILDANVTDAKVLSLDGVKINNNTITNAKLATMANQTVKANISGGVAQPSDISISTLLNAGSWTTTGNSGLIAGTNFVGTTDAVDLVFKANNQESGRINLSLDNTSFGRGSNASITTGAANTTLGKDALKSLTIAFNNTALGWKALEYNLNGSNNTAVGASAMQYLTSGILNTGVGLEVLGGLISGNYNAAFGRQALNNVTTGNYNTAIGYQADVSTNSAIGRIAIGHGASADTDYQFALPNNVTSFKFRGNSFTLPSTDGAANAVLQTDGAGVLSFVKIVDSGIYTPSLTNVTNITSSTAYSCQWMRIGNMVTVSGKVTIDPAATSATELGMSLPVVSNFANEEECAGTAADNTNNNHPVRIIADATNNRAAFVFTPTSNASADYAFIFMYQII
jgi:hypothetical protein